MSRESIAFLKKMARQAASEAKREMPQKRSFRSAVNRACSFQIKMMALWLQREAKLCFKFFLEAVSIF